MRRRNLKILRILKAYALLRRRIRNAQGALMLLSQANLQIKWEARFGSTILSALLKLKPADENEREQQESIRNYLAEADSKRTQPKQLEGVSRVLREQSIQA